MEEFLKRCESVRVKCRVAKEEDMLLKRKLQNDSCESVSPSCCSNSKHEDSSDGVEMSPRSSDLELPSPNKESSMPSAAELERFFAAAEKYEQKRFAQKYNYDIVKDVPLEGRYHWVRLLP
ncbi:cyclin-dependent kinase inhibitor 6-like isoform X3 [Salvia hispanica]|uniref:cyclin-dependent kinase inhibitor 6-like isoform X3 n=1 Tax=Salvia hispanica TaxID=49212 RepID=UPI002008F7AD|nr:cyclin-dependent kinase inhibitor 6-like isoform X3 [Salvia hispanica]